MNIVHGTSNGPQNYIGNYLGPCCKPMCWCLPEGRYLPTWQIEILRVQHTAASKVAAKTPMVTRLTNIYVQTAPGMRNLKTLDGPPGGTAAAGSSFKPSHVQAPVPHKVRSCGTQCADLNGTV